MPLSFISPFMFTTLNFLICVVYPAINTFAYLYKDDIKTIGSPYLKLDIISQPSHSSLYAHFIVYWIIYGITQFVEYILYSILVTIVPFYYEIKLLIFLWLGSSYYKGAGYLYLNYLKFFVKEMLVIGSDKLEQMIDRQTYNQIKDALISISFQNRNVPPNWSQKNKQ